MSNTQRKKAAAVAHNERYEKMNKKKRSQSLSRVLIATMPSMRHAGLDSTSGHESSAAGRKMRRKIDTKFEKIMNGRNKINALMARAGIVGSL